MDLATLIGLVGAMAVVVVTVLLGGQPIVFVNAPSLVIVLCGTVMVTLMKFSVGQFLGATKVAAKAFSFKQDTPEELIAKSVELAQVARKGGILSLEEAEIPNEFMQMGLNLVIDGHDPEVVRSILQKDMNLTVQRHLEGQRIFTSIGDVAPAIGMIGTLIGLVNRQDLIAQRSKVVHA